MKFENPGREMMRARKGAIREEEGVGPRKEMIGINTIRVSHTHAPVR